MQGFNMGRYVPPDQEGLVSGNALHKKRPPGMRANGQQTVRFEMPFAIWCSSCPKPTIIGQGVRFNATKAKVGNYFSSPIFSFRMRHPACGGEIEIRTDPKNTAYVVVSGARKRDLGADEESLVKSRDGLVGGEIVTEKERADMRETAFKNLEKTIEDRQMAEQGKLRIEELEEGARVWEDPYERNRRLRKEFRVGRHGREREAKRSGEVKERLQLGEEFELVPEVEEDGIRAKLVDFGAETEHSERRVDMALAKPLFGESKTTPDDHRETRKDGKEKKGKLKKQLKSEIVAAKRRDNLVSEIVGNTRAARDPFLEFGTNASARSQTTLIPGLKRKRPAETGPGLPAKEEERPEVATAAEGSTATGLVDYDSDD
jgi:coiled-coil domain-containing protein 130